MRIGRSEIHDVFVENTQIWKSDAPNVSDDLKRLLIFMLINRLFCNLYPNYLTNVSRVENVELRFWLFLDTPCLIRFFVKPKFY